MDIFPNTLNGPSMRILNMQINLHSTRLNMRKHLIVNPQAQRLRRPFKALKVSLEPLIRIGGNTNIKNRNPKCFHTIDVPITPIIRTSLYQSTPIPLHH